MLAKYLKQQLEKTETTQIQLARSLGVSRSAVCYYMQGSRTPNIKIIKKLIDYLSAKTKRSTRIVTHEIMSAVFADLEMVQ